MDLSPQDLNDCENALACIREAAEMAVHFDTYIPGTPHTSPLLRGITGDERWWHDTHNRTWDLLANLAEEECAILRENEEFRTILDTLKQYAK